VVLERHGLDLPAEPAARVQSPDPPCFAEPACRLDIRAAGIGSIVWATGYGIDLGWIDVPVLDARGEPVHRGGITHAPGLYFLGLPWLSRMRSSFLSGVGEDAARLADDIAARR
jgi:putative flavoprotein involved in K+ transport